MSITHSEMEAARVAWGDTLIAISKAYEDQGIDAARTVAEEVLDTAYGYNLGPVLFKPTLSGGEQTFRTTKIGALSYFVGHENSECAFFSLVESAGVQFEKIWIACK